MGLVCSFAQLVMQFVSACGSALDFDSEINSGWGLKAKAQCNFLEVKLIYVEDVSLAMRCVSL